MRFRRDSDEESCSKAIIVAGFERHGGLACARVEGHEGECIAMMYDAAREDKICYGCRRKQGEYHRRRCHAAERMVGCVFCLQRFGPISTKPFVSFTQGVDCAAAITSRLTHNAVLCGYYGSSFCDGDAYEFVDGVPVGFENADPVCDGCVRGFVEQGALKQIPGHYLWGFTG